MLRTIAKAIGLGLFIVLVVSALAPAAAADDHDKKTLIATNAPIEIPGKILPAGKYVFRLLDLVGDRNVVRITDESETTVYATVLAVADYRLDATDNTTLTFYEAPRGAPEPLRSWFYPGHRIGVEFVYPKERAVGMVRFSDEPVPAGREPAAAEVAAGLDFEGAELWEEPTAIEPEGLVGELAEVVPPEIPLAVTAETEIPAAMPELPAIEVEEEEAELPAVAPGAELPKTASTTPLLALVGLVLGGLAMTLRLVRG